MPTKSKFFVRRSVLVGKRSNKLTEATVGWAEKTNQATNIKYFAIMPTEFNLLHNSNLVIQVT